jgi:hypothetical protein
MGIFGKAFHLFYAFSFLEIDPGKKLLSKERCLEKLWNTNPENANNR